MPVHSYKALKSIQKVLGNEDLNDVQNLLGPKMPEDKPLPDPAPRIRNWSAKAHQERIDFIEQATGLQFPHLTGFKKFEDVESLKGNIENYIGMSLLPTGIVGPVRVNGSAANGDYYVPMATTEGALIASYNRGARAMAESGGVTALCLVEKVQRTPAFKFRTIAEAGSFLIWTMENLDLFKQISSEYTNHGVLEDIKPHFDANNVTLIFEFTTGDASGQNMVTICTQAVCEYIIEKSPVKPDFWVVEGNLSGDKKASSISFLSTRGKKVTAEAIVKKEVLKSMLKTTAQDLKNAWDIAIVNGIHSGSIGVNFHLSNCLTAIYIACGQDVATVSEGAVGTTRCNVEPNGDLYASVTMPNLIVGTVGGGTGLSTQKECLEMMGCYGTGNARKLAEIIIATALCGELSITASIVTGDFARAHKFFGRKKGG